MHTMKRYQDMPLGVVTLTFGFSGDGSIVHLIRLVTIAKPFTGMI